MHPASISPLPAKCSGPAVPMIGDTQYDYPVILSKELKLWGRAPRARDKPRWMDPL